jgi:putative membrane protein
MSRVVASIVSNALALLASQVVSGVEFEGGFVMLLFGGAILGLVNLVVRPVVVFLSLPFLVLSLGLFYFVLNGLLLWGVSLLVPDYSISGPWAAVKAAVVVSLVNWAFGVLFPRPKEE